MSDEDAKVSRSSRGKGDKELAKQVEQLLPLLNLTKNVDFRSMCADISDIKKNSESSLTFDSFNVFKESQEAATSELKVSFKESQEKATAELKVSIESIKSNQESLLGKINDNVTNIQTNKANIENNTAEIGKILQKLKHLEHAQSASKDDIETAIDSSIKKT